jgi:hypothetical protein
MEYSGSRRPIITFISESAGPRIEKLRVDNRGEKRMRMGGIFIIIMFMIIFISIALMFYSWLLLRPAEEE